jgi:hypothetical protein
MLSQADIDLFKSLFRGREDLYAVRWEKNGRGGYMPAYKVDWSDYKKHKAKGGSFANYEKKEYIPFNDEAIKGALVGEIDDRCLSLIVRQHFFLHYCRF